MRYPDEDGARVVTVAAALEQMREWNRHHDDPCPEDSFEAVLQSVAVPLMQAGLVDGVQPDP